MRVIVIEQSGYTVDVVEVPADASGAAVADLMADLVACRREACIASILFLNPHETRDNVSPEIAPKVEARIFDVTEAWQITKRKTVEGDTNGR